MKNHPLAAVELLHPSGEPVHGLVSVPKNEAVPKAEGIDEIAAVYDAKSFREIDYIFFRRFSDGRSSQVAAYIVDNSDERLDEGRLAELHHQVWLHGIAPLLYVAWPSRVDILACARGPDFWVEEDCAYKPAATLETDTLKIAGAISEQLRRFSSYRLADGTFWEDPTNSGLADYKKAAHSSLIQAVVDADEELGGSENPTLRRLLLLMVLIKYLEDLGVFPSNGWFGRWHKGAESFLDVLKGGKPTEVHNLLSFLERKFNGDVFRLAGVGQKKLTKKALGEFANLIEARTLGNQRYFWELFSFEHIPVEIISHLYQRFVEGGHGKVYTPPFLASLLLDQAMPYESLSGKERVLDPACGSGVFLVGAFRRLVQAWRSRNRWREPDVHTLKRILSHSIYGFELEPFAAELASFSLSLAVCDALTPDVIWKDLKFEPLCGSNLFAGDFFQAVLDAKNNRKHILARGFDVIVGNPPFESRFTEPGKKVNEIARRDNKNRVDPPDNNAAYLFLEQSLDCLKEEGRLCLVQQYGFLYNKNPKDFRRSIFRRYAVERILDFVSVRNLFEKADTKVVAILANANEPAEDHRIGHWTFRRTASVHKRVYFDLDHYDRHRVPQEIAENDPFIWRVNLVGGGRILEMSQRFRSMRTLKKYLDENKDWDYGEGFIAAKTGRRTPAPFLTGKPLLPTSAFTENGINESRISVVEEERFRSAYSESRYTPPIILIKKSETLPIAFREQGFIAYRNEIVGIPAPPSDQEALWTLYESLRDRHAFYQFVLTLHSFRSFLARSTSIHKVDIEEFPLPRNKGDLNLSFWEAVIQNDVLEYMSDYVRLGQNSDLLTKSASEKELKAYANLFVRMLGSVYDNLQASDPIFLDGLICQPFYFGEKPNLSWLSEETRDDLKRLIYEEKQHASLRTIRVLRYYSENVLLIVKPDRLRYWIRSTAIRDADETLLDLRDQGY